MLSFVINYFFENMVNFHKTFNMFMLICNHLLYVKQSNKMLEIFCSIFYFKLNLIPNHVGQNCIAKALQL